MNSYFCHRCLRDFTSAKSDPKLCSLCHSYRWKRHRLTEEERFWAGVDRRGEDDCWLWKRSVNIDGGYGYMAWKGKRTVTTRIALEIVDGVDVPSGMIACHSCDVRYPKGD